MARGFETITVGQLVTADTINDKFIKQGVLYFASTAARDAAVTAPEDGMVCWVRGTYDLLYEYTGSAWAVVLAKGSGTPEGNVTAGVGAVYQRTDGGSGTSLYVKESGSGNTGWVASISSSIGTAKGDLIGFSASGTPVRVGAGTDGQAIVYDSSQAAGIRASGLPNAGVTREGGQTTEASTSSSAFVDVLTASGMNIPAVSPLLIVVSFRKVGTAAATLQVGLKINSTVMWEPSVNLVGSAPEEPYGVVQFVVGPGVTNYGAVHGTYGSSTQGTAVLPGAQAAPRPSAAVTSVAIRGHTNGSDTLYFDDLHVYSLAT